MKRVTGTYLTDTTAGAPAKAFVPMAPPPVPALVRTAEDEDLIARANQAVGRLNGLTRLLPDTSLLIYMYIRKEALLSSEIEGTVSSLEDLLLLENSDLPGVPLEDTRDVLNSVRAIEHGLRLARGGLPIAGRLLRETHGVLLQAGRGASKEPGEYRRSLVRLGGTGFRDATFVPPPAHLVPGCMAALENFLNDVPRRTPTLLKAALAHVQFETIHPFLDGNGRLGRLLITLLLCAEEALQEPTLYLSLYFKTHRRTYYEKLQRVRTHGDWEGWLRFFLQGVLSTVAKAEELAAAMLALFDTHEKLLLRKLGARSSSALRVHQFMRRQPVFSAPKAARGTGLSAPTVTSAVEAMKRLKMVREIKTGKRPRRMRTSRISSCSVRRRSVRRRADRWWRRGASWRRGRRWWRGRAGEREDRREVRLQIAIAETPALATVPVTSPYPTPRFGPLKTWRRCQSWYSALKVGSPRRGPSRRFPWCATSAVSTPAPPSNRCDTTIFSSASSPMRPKSNAFW